MPSFVQFMHNGREHAPDKETCRSWNRDDHGRKFLKCNGTYVDQNRRTRHGQILFWGEWEPESRAVRTMDNQIENGPRYVYEPYYVCPSSYKGLQNTDPFVFGSPFRYSFCQQPSRPSLRNLERASVVLFGSRVGRKFALDTVFVVSDFIPWNRDNVETLLQAVDETYRTVTVNPILEGVGSSRRKSCTDKIDSTTYRSYAGTTVDDPINGMFSFFPCQANNKNSSGFARPIIEMPQITDTMIRGIKITKCKDPDEVGNYWKEVVSQVTKTCSLGIFAQMPPKCETS